MKNEEFLKMIESHDNPNVRKKYQDLKKQMELDSKDEEPIIRDLNKIGLKIDSVWDLVNNKPHPYLQNDFIGEYSIAYPILVKHLDYNYLPKTKEGLIRALTEKQARSVAAEKILDLFYKESDGNLRWVMANALRTLMNWNSRQKHPEIARVLRKIYDNSAQQRV
jgi:hypothetical protein